MPRPVALTLALQHDATSSVDVAVGESVRLGSCGCGGCDYDVVVADAPWSSISLLITGYASHWVVSNSSPEADVRCRDLEDCGQQIVIPPGRSHVVMPFELTAIDFPTNPGSHTVLAFGPEPQPSRSTFHPCPKLRGHSVKLRPGTAYFAVLEELCRSVSDSVVSARRAPTSREVADRLTARGMPLTRRAVDHHVDHLIGLMGLTEARGAAGLRRRDLLVREAIRRDLLREQQPGHADGPAT